MVHEDEILGNRLETTEINTNIIIQNQLELRNLIRANNGNSRRLLSVEHAEPNMIRLDMSLEELAMKSVGLVFIGLFAGVLIGPCIWINKNAITKKTDGPYREL